jgi:hypothetical protein
MSIKMCESLNFRSDLPLSMGGVFPHLTEPGDHPLPSGAQWTNGRARRAPRAIRAPGVFRRRYGCKRVTDRFGIHSDVFARPATL